MGDLWMSNDTGGWVHVGKVTDDGLSIATTEFKVDARQADPQPVNTTVSEMLSRPLNTRTEYKITIPADKIDRHALRTIFGMDVAPTSAPTQEARETYRAHTDHVHWVMDTQKVARQSYVELLRELRVREYLKDMSRKQRTEDAIMNDHSDFAKDVNIDRDHITDALVQTAIAEFDALEPTDDGTVISWMYERRKTINAYHFDTERFEYVAIRAAGRWYPTGSIGHKRFGGVSWRELGAMVQTDALRKGHFYIVTGWAHRDDVTDGE